MPGRNRDADVETSGHRVAKERRDDLGDWGCHIYASVCKIASWWEPVTKHAHLSSALCGDPEGWDEGLGGKSRREGIYVHM